MTDYGDYESRARGPPRHRNATGAEDTPCRACSDFQSWVKMKKAPKTISNDCPLDREQLGNHSWAFLHTVAAYYPKKPTIEQQTRMSTFLELFGQFYPCDHCADDFRKEMQLSPPNVTSREALSHWMCEQHNVVNQKLAKKKFDCTKVLERWLYGPKDGSCG